jgi:methyl-accepting chemotaxis protein
MPTPPPLALPGEPAAPSGRRSLLQAGYRAGDGLFLWLLPAHLLLLAALAPLRGTWTAVGVGAVTVAVAVAVILAARGTLLSRLAVTTAIFIVSAVMIHQTGGMIEMHFHIFASLAFLLVYRDWRLPVWGAVVVASHHALFNWLQARGAGVHIFTHGHGWGIVAVHAAWVVFEVAILVFLARRLAAEAAEAEALVVLAERMGAGDLAARGEGGKVGAVAAFHEGAGRLGEMVVSIRGRAGEVSSVAAHLSGAAEHVMSAATGVADSLTRVAQGAQEQAANTQRMAGALGQMVGAVDDVTGRAEGASTATEHAASVARDGARVVREAVERMARIRDAVRSSAAQIAEMRDRSERIGRVTQVITEMAEQTNLLALNAAIEAARAGDHGRGFAVVANEVRILASRSGDAAREVAELVAAIQETTAGVVQSMGQGTAEAEEGASLAEDAGQALKEIVSVVEHTTGDVRAIADAAGRIAQGSRAALRDVGLADVETGGTAALEALVVASRLNADAAEDAAASVQEINASMEEMASSAAGLERIAAQLLADVSRFRTAADATPDDAPPAPADEVRAPRAPASFPRRDAAA